MSRLAIADPPYLGRAARWYGEAGRGHGGGRGRADEHPEAALWDMPEQHEQLVARLVEQYDGWAIAATPTSLGAYLGWVPEGTRVLMWHRSNAVPSSHRVRWSWEPVLVFTPEERRGHGTGMSMNDVLVEPIPRSGFTGAKPAAWTRWVLDALAYDPAGDVVEDLFPGSGAVAAEIGARVLL